VPGIRALKAIANFERSLPPRRMDGTSPAMTLEDATVQQSARL